MDLNKQFGLARLALSLSRGGGDVLAAAEIAARTGFKDVETLCRAAINGGATSSGAWGSELAESYAAWSQAFLGGIEPQSPFDRAARYAVPIAPRTKLTVLSSQAGGATVPEGAAIPVRAATFDLTSAEPHCVASLHVLSDELNRLAPAAAQTVLNRLMADGVVAAANAKFLPDLIAAVPTVNLHASTGDFLLDLRQAIASLALRGSRRVMAVSTPNIVNALATDERDAFAEMTHAGGKVRGVELIPSDHLGANVLLVFDPSRLAIAPGTLAIDASREACLEMLDGSLTGNTVTPASSSLVSMFATNSVAFRATRWIAYAIADANGVAVVDGPDYGAAS